MRSDEWTDWDGWDEKVTYSKCSLEAWSKRACLINANIECYREAVVEKLRNEGYVLTSPETPEPESVEAIDEEAKESAKEAYREENEAIKEIESPTEHEYAQLKNQRSRTRVERLKIRKGELERRYCGIEVTPELVKKDDLEWYPQLRLHFYLTIGSTLLAARDKRKIAALQGDDGGIFAPDINRQCLSVKIAALKVLGIERFLNSDAEFTKASLSEWFDSILVPIRWDIKDITGVAINPKTDSGISIAQRLLSQLGLKLTKVAHRRIGGDKRERVYKFIPPTDERGRIFASCLKQAKPESNTEEMAA